MKCFLLLLLMAANFGAHAALYKCEKNGQATYSDKPCVGIAVIISRDAKKSYPGLDEGLAAFESGDYDLALTKLSPLAEKGLAMAQNTLGRMYMQGQGVPQDFDKALVLFRKAARQELANAQSNLGVMYAAGNGVSQDYKEAVSWFKKAASQGFVIAMNNLAEMYENGLGVKPDHVEAAKWRNKAQAIEETPKRDEVTIRTVGSDEYDEGLGYYYRYAFNEAFELFSKAAARGHPEAMRKLASMYQHGQGTPKSDALSQYWAYKAKVQGYTPNDGRDGITLIEVSPDDERRVAPSAPAMVGGSERLPPGRAERQPSGR